MLAELCERLTAVGVPLTRVAVFVRTLNPNNIGRRFIWRPAAPIEILDGDFDLFNRDEYLSNPIAVVQREGKSIRRRLIDPNSPMDYPVLAEFKAGGMTDYLASPLISTDGLIHVATWSTTDPDGFSDSDIRILESVVPLLARVAEIRALRRTVVTLLDTYVGHQSGERILAGRIRRGDTRGYPRRHLAVRSARLHRTHRPAAGRHRHRRAEPLFRLPDPANPGARRRSAEADRRRAAGDLSGGR